MDQENGAAWKWPAFLTCSYTLLRYLQIPVKWSYSQKQSDLHRKRKCYHALLIVGLTKQQSANFPAHSFLPLWTVSKKNLPDFFCKCQRSHPCVNNMGTNNPSAKSLFVTFVYVICCQMTHGEKCQWVYLISWSITCDCKGCPAAPQSQGSLFRHAPSNIFTQKCCTESSCKC